MSDDNIARCIHAWSIPGWESEKPSKTAEAKELWCYTNKPSYHLGEEVDIFIHSTATTLTLKVVRDGLHPQTVLVREIKGDFRQHTPSDAYAKGCGWNKTTEIELSEVWQKGFYLIQLSADIGGQIIETDHYFILKADKKKHPAVMLLTTSTLAAYNDWGGANYYRGLHTEDSSPESALLRPLAKGFLRKPEDAPRNSHDFTPPPHWIPQHDVYDWALQHGYTRHHADAFWATYERPFVTWAEMQGYQFDYLTQWDLHFEQDLLNDYRCVIIVGHDEYWSWEMRDELDDYLEQGGNLARFAGNYIWQVRLSEDGNSQYCYKVPQEDPLRHTTPERVTTFWEHPLVNRPSATSIGLTGLGGCYARYGNTVPRSSGGFTVYRPEHWAFKGTDLYYGDVFGGSPFNIASFEMDGLEYTFKRGLPYPTGEDGVPEHVEILAMTQAVLGADDKWQGKVPLGAPAWEVADFINIAYEGTPPDHLKDKRYGCGVVASYSKGKGYIFNAGTCEWVKGLIREDVFTETITKNVLNRLTQS